MNSYYRYTETNLSVPDRFTKSILVADKNIIVEFVWPTFVEEEIKNINLACYARMAGMGLSDGRQSYNYYDYWEDAESYIVKYGFDAWLADEDKAKPIILDTVTDKEAWVIEQLTFYHGCKDLFDFYNELLVWEIRMSYRGNTISCPVNLGGWVQFPDESFSFRFTSGSKFKIGREDLPYLDIYFEVKQ